MAGYTTRREHLEAELAELVALHNDLGQVPDRAVAEVAEATTYSDRHVRRRLAERLDGVKPQLTRWIPEPVHLEAVFITCGNVMAAHKRLSREGVDVPPGRTFRRRVTEALGTTGIASAKLGAEGVRNAQIYLKVEDKHRNHTWEMDHVELPVQVIPTGHSTPIKPHLTIAIDQGTRMPMGYTVTFGRPTAESVRAAIIMGVSGWHAPNGVFVGGAPILATWDRGLEFLADDITATCHGLRVAPMPVRAYSPHLKPRVEKFNRSIQDELCRHMAGFTNGPKDLRGNGYLEKDAVTEKYFLAEFEDWMEYYVLEREHQGLQGRTPLQAWMDDATLLRTREPHELFAGMLVATKKHTVTKNGIRFRGVDYVDHDLGKLKGRKVEVRYLQHVHDEIEVFYEGQHYCTAVDPTAMTDVDREEHLRRRAEERQQLAAIKRRAHVRRRKVASDAGGLIRLDDGVANLDDLELLSDGDRALEEILSGGSMPEAEQGVLL